MQPEVSRTKGKGASNQISLTPWSFAWHIKRKRKEKQPLVLRLHFSQVSVTGGLESACLAQWRLPEAALPHEIDVCLLQPANRSPWLEPHTPSEIIGAAYDWTDGLKLPTPLSTLQDIQ